MLELEVHFSNSAELEVSPRIEDSSSSPLLRSQELQQQPVIEVKPLTPLTLSSPATC